MLGRYENQTSENVFQFPLEYYISESYFMLYKTIMSKVYSTEIMIDEDGNIMLNGDSLSTDSFISTFLRNHHAIQILEKPELQLQVNNA